MVQPSFRKFQHHGIAVEADEFSRFADAIEDFSAVAAGSHGAIDDDQPRLQFESVDDFPKQNRLMDRAAAKRDLGLIWT